MPGALWCPDCTQRRVALATAAEENGRLETEGLRKGEHDRFLAAVEALTMAHVKPSRRSLFGIEQGSFGRVRQVEVECDSAWHVGEMPWSGRRSDGTPVTNLFPTGVTETGEVVRMQPPRNGIEQATCAATLDRLVDALRGLLNGSLPPRDLSERELKRVWKLTKDRNGIADRLYFLTRTYGTLEQPSISGGLSRSARTAYRHIARYTQQIADLDAEIAELDPGSTAGRRSLNDGRGEKL